jgi:hypothetical protein
MDGVDIITKLYKLRERLAELPDEDQQIVIENLNRHESGNMPLIRDVPRIAWMQVPGAPPLLRPILQEGTVTVQRKHLDDVIWRYMPLEVLFSLLLTEKLHFSPLSSMDDTSEGELPQSAFERAKAQLPQQFQNANTTVTADTVTASLTRYLASQASVLPGLCQCSPRSDKVTLRAWRSKLATHRTSRQWRTRNWNSRTRTVILRCEDTSRALRKPPRPG